jgi:hypothetical protein
MTPHATILHCVLARDLLLCSLLRSENRCGENLGRRLRGEPGQEEVAVACGRSPEELTVLRSVSPGAIAHRGQARYRVFGGWPGVACAPELRRSIRLV